MAMVQQLKIDLNTFDDKRVSVNKSERVPGRHCEDGD